MEKRKLNDEVNRLLRDLVFQKLAWMELAEIINGSWDLDGIWGMLQPIGKIRATLWRRIRVTSSTAIYDAQWKFPMVGGELLVSWEGLHWTALPIQGQQGAWTCPWDSQVHAQDLPAACTSSTVWSHAQAERTRSAVLGERLAQRPQPTPVRTRIQADYWELLPWKLCGISCSSLSISQIMARECLGMWARLTQAQKRSSHPVTRRFQCFPIVFPMFFPRVSPWFLLCFSQGFPMVFTCFFPRFSYCCPMVFPCFPLFSYSFSMVFPWFSDGFPWFSHVFQCFFPWFPVFFPWFSDGFRWFPLVFPMFFPNGFPMPVIFPLFSHGFAMVFHGFPIVFPWFSHVFPCLGVPIVFPCFSPCFSHGFPAFSHGFPMSSHGLSHGFPMSSHGLSHGFPMFSRVFPMVFPCLPMVFPCLPMVYPMVFPCLPMVYPTVFPCFPMFFPWFSHVFPWFIPWFSHVFPWFIPWFSHVFPCFSHGFPMRSHVFSHGFPMFSGGKPCFPMFMPTGGKPNQRFACFYVFHGVKGVGWGGLITFTCTSSHTFTCTSSHTWCYATVRLLALPHIHDATQLFFFAFPHIHDATLLYVFLHFLTYMMLRYCICFLHFLTYMMLRYCTSSCTSSHTWCYATGTIDNAWRLLKQAVPKSLASKKGNAYNPALIKHCRSWQWRWENTGTSLFQKTAKVLNETVQSRWLSLAIEKNARRNVLKPAYFKKTAKKGRWFWKLMNAENIAKRTKKNKTQWHGEYHELNCLPKPCVSHPMSRIWTPKTDKTWVQFPTRRDVYPMVFPCLPMVFHFFSSPFLVGHDGWWSQVEFITRSKDVP